MYACIPNKCPNPMQYPDDFTGVAIDPVFINLLIKPYNLHAAGTGFGN